MADPTSKATPAAYIDSLHPREWVTGGLYRQLLRDNQRDWGSVHETWKGGKWVAIAFPGNGRHEYMGTFKTADEAKAAVEARLAR